MLVFNAILVRGDATGDTVFYGKGAGKLPTASAVVADIMDCAAHMDKRKEFGWESGTQNYVVDYNELETVMYVRAEADDKDKAVNDIKSVFEDAEILAADDEIVFITDEEKEKDLNSKLDSIDGLNVLSKIRVVDY